jgi:hypothetical protein
VVAAAVVVAQEDRDYILFTLHLIVFDEESSRKGAKKG